jgi:hypothetical protein
MEDDVLKFKGGLRVTSLAVALIMIMAGMSAAAEYSSMTSYESLLRSQTVLIGSFENLLKNTTLNSSMSYQFLDSFDDLAERQQLGLYSFEDVVSFNWSDLDTQQRINLTASYEDLLRREAIVLSSNEALLKRAFCNLTTEQKQELLDRFEARLKYEVVLYEKFEDWLHFQQMIETDNGGAEYETWMAFLDSFEDLIRRQADLLDSFEMLMKIRCDTTYLSLDKNSTLNGNAVTYTYNITAGTNNLQNVAIEDSLLGTIAEDFTLAAGNSRVFTRGPYDLRCADCDNCTCRVCNFATACGEVITSNGNFTACVVSDQVCRVINDFTVSPPPIVYPGIKIDEVAAGAAEEVAVEIIDEAAAETANDIPVEETAEGGSKEVSKPCPTCSKK